MNWQDYFEVDTEKGVLVWRHLAHRTPQWNALYAGKVAGHKHKGPEGKPTFVGVRIFRRMVQVHKIIWETVNGPIPDGFVLDHINRNPYDNSLINLRVCKQAENCRNRSKGKNNTSGIKGVSWYKPTGRWRADIMVDCRYIHLGLHRTKGLAAVAYAKASIRYHGTFACPI